MRSHFLNRLFTFALILVLFVSAPAFSALEKEKIEQKPIDLSHPKQSFYSAPAERLGDGFANVVYGPFELVYQMKEEIKRTDPIRGIIPGLLRGVTWFGTREVVGIFEIVTFFIPLKPHLKPFDTDWLHL